MYVLKIVTLILALTLLLSSCAKADAETQAVIDDINSIGEVELKDGKLLGEIENKYAQLTDEQRKRVKNIEDLYDARKELDELLLKNPVPFCNVNWETTSQELIEIMGREPDDEYDSEDYGRILVYNDIEYEGYIETAKFGMINDTLTRVFYTFDKYDENTYEYFEKLYYSMYGEPDLDIGFGKRWDEDFGSVGVAGVNVLDGHLECNFLSPTILEEE